MPDTTILRKRVRKFIDKADEKELRMIYRLFEIDKEDDWWPEISKEHQKAIKEAIREADRGDVISHEEMVKKYRKWLKK
jgi:hypothetical protein